jgi:hypothetical protein
MTEPPRPDRPNWAAISGIVGILGLILGILTYVHDVGQDRGQPSGAPTVVATPGTVGTTAPDTPTGSEWSGTVQMPVDSAVDLDATPPYVDKVHLYDNANEFGYDGDGMLDFLTRASQWKDASDPSESQCADAIDQRSDNGVVSVEAGQRLCVKIYERSGVRYACVTIVTATSRTLVFDLVRWTTHPSTGSKTSGDNTGNDGWSGWALFWWTLLAVVLIGLAGFLGVLSDSNWFLLVALVVLVIWLIIVWTSMAWWAMLLAIALMVVAFVAAVAFADS